MEHTLFAIGERLGRQDMRQDDLEERIERLETIVQIVKDFGLRILILIALWSAVFGGLASAPWSGEITATILKRLIGS